MVRWLLVLLIAVLAAAGSAAEFRLSPSGDQPFSTLLEARDAVRASIAAGMTEDAVVILHDGTYFLDEPFSLDERDSGRDGHRVVFRGAPEETARIVGGRPLTGWREAGEGGPTG